MTRSLVVTTWFPDTAHPSRTPFCLAHVHALQDAGIDVEVIHIQLNSSVSLAENYLGVPITRLGLSPTQPRTWAAATRAISRKLASADVLHTMAFSSVLVAAVPWMLGRRAWVHTEHWNGVISPRSVGLWWRCLSMLRHILRLPHVVTGVTGELAQDMARFTRTSATRVVPCVVEPPDSVKPYPPARPLRLVGVGLLNERKNPLVAIDTIAWLVANEVDVTYRWIGDGPLRAEAERHAAAAGVADRVTFTGAVPPTHVWAEISTAHIFFVPTTQENFFTAAAEAIVAGRMVVLPRAGGFIEYCTAANSVLADDWSPQTLGRSIIRARDRLAGTSPASIAATLGNRFSRASIGQQFLDVYREVCR